MLPFDIKNFPLIFLLFSEVDQKELEKKRAESKASTSFANPTSQLGSGSTESFLAQSGSSSSKDLLDNTTLISELAVRVAKHLSSASKQSGSGGRCDRRGERMRYCQVQSLKIKFLVSGVFLGNVSFQELWLLVTPDRVNWLEWSGRIILFLLILLGISIVLAIFY